MQGFSSVDMPMSAVTVGSLADLGYVVDLTRADPFTFTGAVHEGASHEGTSHEGALRAGAVRATKSPLRGTDLTTDVAGTEIWSV